MISSTNLISSHFIRYTGRASSQPSGNLSNSFPDGIPVGNLIPLMRREFPMGSHNLLFGYRFLSCSDPKLNLGAASWTTRGCRPEIRMPCGTNGMDISRRTDDRTIAADLQKLPLCPWRCSRRLQRSEEEGAFQARFPELRVRGALPGGQRLTNLSL